MTKTKTIAVCVMLAFAGAASAQTATPPATAAPATAAPDAAAREQCVKTINADPEFAASIVKTVDAAKRDTDTIKVHRDAEYHVQKNERHVFYAYAAMWLVAAAFVVFLWRRQQALTAEIAALRRDLDTAASDGAGKDRS